ncbi:MlaA family lipoprotein [Sandarakinorhabdus rubra]|uniref:MlaA family lipoprotein n=1 Tax=Sandarakinorhabdus rubra TaxID=2672568 RepID=UPI0013DD4F8C|nr:VacJ family lipoprotein [Sandarakinorhabdus rubra]
MSTKAMRRPPALLLVALLLPLAACTTTGSTDLSRAEADPWERSNRRVWAFNKGLDRWVVKPVASGYRAVVPKPARTAVSNAYGNYGEPANFVNAVLQGKFAQAFRTLDRFLLNSTLGVAGVADVATGLGRPKEPEDFGQTLARWGVKAGPYMVLPLFGPSTLRDGIMTPVDFFIDPADFIRNAWLSPGWDVRIAVAGGRILNARNNLIETGADALLADSLDDYALARSAFLQRRRLQLFDGQLPAEEDPFAEPAEPEPAAEPPAPASPTPALPAAAPTP